MIGWALVWLGHWGYANRTILHVDWRGVEERTSRTRVAAFVVVILVAAATTMTDVASALSAAMRPLLPSPDFPVGANLPAVVAPLLLTAMWLVAWWIHLRWFRAEPAPADPLRALDRDRLVSHGVAAVALAIGAVGGGWLLGYLFNLVFGGSQSTAPDLSSELAQFVPLAVVGLGAWLWFWRGVVTRRRADPFGEARSTIRRTFLYITLGVALVVAIAAAAVILYRLVGLLINAGIGGGLVSDLASPIGALLGAGIVLLYHGLALRSDQRLVAATAIHTANATAAVTAGPAAAQALDAGGSTPGLSLAGATPSPEATVIAVVRRALTIIGPEDELEAALAAVRAGLPDGVQIIDAPA